jgi:coenzyme F420-reducing hydrogenase delta subunit
MADDTLVVFGCRHTAGPVISEGVLDLPDYDYRELPCLASLDPLMVMRALDDGADAVVAVGCLVGRCRHLTGSQRAKRVMSHVGDVLEEVGVSRDRIGLVLGSPIEPKVIIDGLEEFFESLRGDEG